MKQLENTEDYVRRGKAKIATSQQMDKRVLGDSFAAMDETAAGKLSVVRIILQSRATKIAAAAVIIIAVGLSVNHSTPPVQEPREIRKITRSPAEMLNMMSLTTAYRHGGIEEVERQCDKAVLMLGPRTYRISLWDLLEGSNG